MAPLAHIMGVPVEETLGEFAPAAVVLMGALRATMRRKPPRDDSARNGAGPTRHGPLRVRDREPPQDSPEDR